MDTPAGLAIMMQYPAPAAPVAAQAPAAPVPAAPQPTAPAAGFGTTTAAAPTTPGAGVTEAGSKLKALLQAKLGIKPSAPAAG